MKHRTRYGLLLNEKRDGDYFHLTFHVVTLGPTAEDRRWFDQYPNSGLVSNDTIRNPRAEDGVLDLKDLAIHSQGENNRRDGGLYGWSVEYHDVYNVDLRRSKRMHKTLAHIDREMTKIYNSFGNPSTYGSYVSRVASAVKADTIVIGKTQRGWSYSENEHKFLTIAEGVDLINHQVTKWMDEGKERVLATNPDVNAELTPVVPGFEGDRDRR